MKKEGLARVAVEPHRIYKLSQDDEFGLRLFIRMGSWPHEYGTVYTHVVDVDFDELVKLVNESKPPPPDPRPTD